MARAEDPSQIAGRDTRVPAEDGDGGDSTYLYDIGVQRRLAPIERLRRVGGAPWVAAIKALIDARETGIVVGDAAAALHGWPLSLPSDGGLEVCVRSPEPGYRRQVGGLATIGASSIEGLDHDDLAQECERMPMAGGQVLVASPFDLLLIAHARGQSVQAGALSAVIEHRRRWPDGLPARRQLTAQDAQGAVDAWLTSPR